MERKGRSRASIALRVAVPVVLAVLGATVAYRHIADASSQGPIPADKQERADRDLAGRGHTRARKPADPNAARPASSPATYETGIVADDESPSRDFVVRNRWGGSVGAHRYIVFAGARSSDLSQGVLLVQGVTAEGGAGAPEPYDAPVGGGALHVVSAEGARLTLATDSGTSLVFDLAALRFE